MSAARYDLEWDFDHRDMAQSSSGEWVKYDDYASLQAALREALDGWHYAINGFGPEPHDIEELDKFLADLDWPSKRIEFLRAKFLDDK